MFEFVSGLITMGFLVAGLFFFRQESEAFHYTFGANPQGINPSPFFPIYRTFPSAIGLLTADSTVDTDAWAVFASTDVKLTPALKLTLGLRYTKEEKEFDHVQVDQAWFPFGDRTFVDQTRSDDDLSGKLGR